MNFDAIESTTAKAIIPEADKQQVADIRTKTDAPPADDVPPAGETEAEQAAKLLETQNAEKATRKETALAAGKTEAEFEAEETANTKTPEQIAEEAKQAEAKTAQETADAKLREDTLKEFLKSMGVTTEQELRDKLNPRKPKTEEELKQEKEIYLTDLAKFAVKEKIFNNEELLAYQNMSKMPDTDLVFKEFAHNYKEANKDRKIGDEKDPVTADELQDKFNELYHIDSENKTLKEQGESNLAIKAKSLRQPLEEKYNDAKSIYDNEMEQAQAVPEFKKFIQSILATSIPEALTYEEGDTKTAVGLDKLDKDKFEKDLIASIGDREFAAFIKGKGSPEQRARIEKEITKELLYLNHKEIARQAFENGRSVGTKTTAPGAQTRFSEPAKAEGKKVSDTVTAEDNKKIADAMKRG